MFSSSVRENERQLQFICNELYLFVVKAGTPSDVDLRELADHIRATWKTLARRLDVRDSALDEIDHSNEALWEKGYHMLRHWKRRGGTSATYTVLYDALHHELVMRPDLVEKICCD